MASRDQIWFFMAAHASWDDQCSNSIVRCVFRGVGCSSCNVFLSFFTLNFRIFVVISWVSRKERVSSMGVLVLGPVDALVAVESTSF